MRIRLILGLFLATAVLIPSTSPAHRARADAPSVVINELMWMGSSLSSADEWVELRNTTDQAVDMSGWQLTKKSGGAEVAMLILPSNSTIPAGGFFVVANYAQTSTNSALHILPNFVDTDVALSNSALQVKLYDASHNLVDTADDGVGNPLAGVFDSAQHQYASMERNPVPGDGAVASSWHAASRAVGFKDAAVEFGTPGSTNSNGQPVANAGPDLSGTVGEAVNFDGSDSFDPEGQPMRYHWDFGDGTTSDESTPTHVFSTPGTFEARLTVNDGLDTDDDQIRITVDVKAATNTSNSPSSTETTATSPEHSCRGLTISEIFPNPTGVDSGEFIELVNGDEEIMTGACVVYTSSTRSYTLPVGRVLKPGEFFVLPKTETKLTLNNGGTTVRLVDVDASELDRVTYASAPEGSSWARIATNWLWTIRPTPSEANVHQAAPASPARPKANTASSKKAVAPERPIQPVSLRQLQELDSGDRVSIQGVVVAPRDVLGSTLAYIQTDDGGVSISIPNGEKAIELGQTITLNGTVRLKSGRRYVTVAAKSLKVLSAGAPLVPPLIATDDISVDQADQLVQVKGLVSLASGNRIEVDDGSGPTTVYLKSSTGIVRPKVKAGDTVAATGIVSVATSGVRILPRSPADLRVERVLGATSEAAPLTTSRSSARQTMQYWLLVGLGALAAVAKPLWRAWRAGRKEKPSSMEFGEGH